MSTRELFFKVTGNSSLNHMRVNDMGAHFALSLEWKEVTLEQTQELANNGEFVVCSYINPNPKASGHVSVVVPVVERDSDSWKCMVSMTMNTGENN